MVEEQNLTVFIVSPLKCLSPLISSPLKRISLPLEENMQASWLFCSCSDNKPSWIKSQISKDVLVKTEIQFFSFKLKTRLLPPYFSSRPTVGGCLPGVGEKGNVGGSCWRPWPQSPPLRASYANPDDWQRSKMSQESGVTVLLWSLASCSLALADDWGSPFPRVPSLGTSLWQPLWQPSCGSPGASSCAGFENAAAHPPLKPGHA